ncbi:MAG TPA: hypothetical protein VJ647_02010 [Chitinophagaceae bacterium]|nr:hypothetical protein [Chitinophagaceae bacterium]
MAEQFTIEQYNTLCNAIAQGVTSVRYGDKSVSYRSLPEMLRVKALMEAALDISPRKVRKKPILYNKGLL